MNTKYETWTDEDLAAACKKHDGSAFQELMNRYIKQIFNFSRQYGRTPEDTEDITQDTFFKVWKYIGRYAKGRKFRPWLYTIARNTALDYIKKKRATLFSDIDDSENDIPFAETLEDQEPAADEIFAKTHDVNLLTKALDNLHPDHRSILVLHYHEDLTFDEIADVIGKPMNTVKSWHRRALLKLRGLMAEPNAPLSQKQS